MRKARKLEKKYIETRLCRQWTTVCERYVPWAPLCGSPGLSERQRNHLGQWRPWLKPLSFTQEFTKIKALDYLPSQKKIISLSLRNKLKQKLLNIICPLPQEYNYITLMARYTYTLPCTYIINKKVCSIVLIYSNIPIDRNLKAAFQHWTRPCACLCHLLSEVQVTARASSWLELEIKPTASSRWTERLPFSSAFKALRCRGAAIGCGLSPRSSACPPPPPPHPPAGCE